MVNYFYSKTKPKKYNKTKESIVFNIRIKSIDKLHEILDIENEEKNRWLEKVIESYVPVPSKKTEGRFIPLYWGRLRRMLKKDPHIYMVSLHYNKTIGPYNDAVEDFNKDKLTWEEFEKLYLERLEKEDAQERIKELIKLSDNRDIYIISMEDDDYESTRRIFCNYVNKLNEVKQ